MKKQLSKTLFVLLALGLAMPVFARTSLYDMERSQSRSIQHGVRSGELTRNEARVLRKEQRHIRQLKRRFLRDGHFSRREQRTLRHRYASASRHIYRLKHNRRRNHVRRHHHRSPWGYGGYGRLGYMFY